MSTLEIALINNSNKLILSMKVLTPFSSRVSIPIFIDFNAVHSENKPSEIDVNDDGNVIADKDEHCENA